MFLKRNCRTFARDPPPISFGMLVIDRRFQRDSSDASCTHSLRHPVRHAPRLQLRTLQEQEMHCRPADMPQSWLRLSPMYPENLEFVRPSAQSIVASYLPENQGRAARLLYPT